MQREDIAKFAQSCFQEFPTIVLGSGASVDLGLPSMGDLSCYLCKKLETDSQNEKTAWLRIKEALANGQHLETALEAETLPPTLLSNIVRLTWQCVNERDKSLLFTAASNNIEFALSQLLIGMFNSTRHEAHIVTTNYDRVAEYACNSSGVFFQTGFAPGYVQKWESTERVKFSHGVRSSRVVKL